MTIFDVLAILAALWLGRMMPKLFEYQAFEHRVSGSLSLPSRDTFHLSFTVLLHYRSPARI